MFNLKITGSLIFLFLVIFTPAVVFPFNIIHVLSLLAVLFLLTKYKSEFLKIIGAVEIKFFLVLNIIVFFYSASLSAFVNGDYGAAYYAISTVIEVLPCLIFVSIFLVKRGFDLYRLYDLMLTIGLLQAVIVIAELIFPGLRDWVFANSVGDIWGEIYDSVGGFRLYGFARGYTFSMPLYLGLCAMMAFVLAKIRSSKYYLFIPFYLLTILLNARVALIAFVVAPLVIVFYRVRKNPVKELFWIVTFVFLAIAFVEFIGVLNQDASSVGTWYWWLNQGLDEIRDYFYNNQMTGNLQALGDDMWFSPEGSALIFGTGENVFGRNSQSSDIGYVVNLYYGGVLFSSFLYSAYFIFFLPKFKWCESEKLINISLIIFLIVANFKGNVFRPNEIINGALMLSVFSISLKKLRPVV